MGHIYTTDSYSSIHNVLDIKSKDSEMQDVHVSICVCVLMCVRLVTSVSKV